MRFVFLICEQVNTRGINTLQPPPGFERFWIEKSGEAKTGFRACGWRWRIG
jgi:hypothetical protein